MFLILIGTYFVINLTLAVLFMNFLSNSKMHKEDEEDVSYRLCAAQENFCHRRTVTACLSSTAVLLQHAGMSLYIACLQ